MKNLLNSFTGLNKKLITYLVIAIGGIIMLFIVLGIISSLRGKRMSFEKVESKMKEAAKSYYKDKTSELPSNNGEQIVIDVTTLEEAGKMKNLSSLEISLDLDFKRGMSNSLKSYDNSFNIVFRPYEISFIRTSNYSDESMDQIQNTINQLFSGFEVEESIFC